MELVDISEKKTEYLKLKGNEKKKTVITKISEIFIGAPQILREVTKLQLI